MGSCCSQRISLRPGLSTASVSLFLSKWTIFILLLLLVCLSLVKSTLTHRPVSCQGREPCEECETDSISWAVCGPRLESCGHLDDARDPPQNPQQILLPLMLFETISTSSQRKTLQTQRQGFGGDKTPRDREQSARLYSPLNPSAEEETPTSSPTPALTTGHTEDAPANK